MQTTVLSTDTLLLKCYFIVFYYFRLEAGDRFGVVIREGCTLHFLVNGEDQGEAGTGLPGNLYAVIDLYGQATQATIVSHCPSCSPTTPTPTTNSPFYP